jgi:hypothetical protein
MGYTVSAKELGRKGKGLGRLLKRIDSERK